MIKNYFLVALRHFRRNKIFAVINVLGLSGGISAALVIFLIVNYDFGFDHFEKNGDRIYRVVQEYTADNGVTQHFQDVRIPLGPAIQKEITGIELIAPFLVTGKRMPSLAIPRADGGPATVFRNLQDQIFADSRYFDLLQYTWLSGSAKTSLSEPYQVVLTERNARKYYPGLSPTGILGRSIVFDDTVHAVITGVVKNIADKTDFNFGTFISRSTLETARLKPQCWDIWGCTNSADQLFIRLAPGMSSAPLILLLNKVYKAHNPPTPTDHSTVAINLQPLSDLPF